MITIYETIIDQKYIKWYTNMHNQLYWSKQSSEKQQVKTIFSFNKSTLSLQQEQSFHHAYIRIRWIIHNSTNMTIRQTIYHTITNINTKLHSIIAARSRGSVEIYPANILSGQDIRTCNKDYKLITNHSFNQLITTNHLNLPNITKSIHSRIN